MQLNRRYLSLLFFFISWVLLCLYSFSQKDLNLTVFDHPMLRPFYRAMETLGYSNRPLSTYIFIANSAVLLLCYLIRIRQSKAALSFKQLLVMLAFLIATSLPAQPLFSHDIYNYLFNTKMVLLYKADPHTQVALDFPDDPWLRFMHNVHTPAPYGYGWTAISLLPYSFSGNSFTKAYVLMKLFISSLFVLEVFVFYKLAKRLFDQKIAVRRTLILALNPLILTEVFIVGHNDSVMMLPVLLSLLLLYDNPSLSKTVLAWIAWLFSVITKYASLVLAPFMLLRKKVDLFTWGGLALLLVLLSRPGQLHSWYLHWGMVLLMLSKRSWAITLTLLLTAGGLLRYAPYIWFGNWDHPVPLWRWVILLTPLIAVFIPKVRKSFTD